MTAAERALLLALTRVVVAHLRDTVANEIIHDALAELGRLHAAVVEDIATGLVRQSGVEPFWSPGAVEAARDRVEAGDA